MIYYCIPCDKVICSDCYMFSEEHKTHKIVKSKEIYERKIDSINKEINELRKKIRE